MWTEKKKRTWCDTYTRSSLPLPRSLVPSLIFSSHAETYTSKEDPLGLLALGLELSDEGGGVGVDKVEPGACSPVAEEAGLDVVLFEGPGEEAVLAKEDLGRRAGGQ